MKKIPVFIFLYFFFISNLFAFEDYFLTLRNEKVNLRQGPSFDYPIKLFYKKKLLPVLIQDKFGNFRKIKDHENNSGWIHLSQLSKKSAAISTIKNLIVFKSPTIYSRPIILLEKGKLCQIKKCNYNWCKIKVGKYIGWVEKKSLWGRF
ncbi:SH3 domain-containing protein [Pelagibacteraceae bacterium]|nr:SH3 domain-containing protein [Pelagibacteraceae bacterium]